MVSGVNREDVKEIRGLKLDVKTSESKRWWINAHQAKRMLKGVMGSVRVI